MSPLIGGHEGVKEIVAIGKNTTALLRLANVSGSSGSPIRALIVSSAGKDTSRVGIFV